MKTITQAQSTSYLCVALLVIASTTFFLASSPTSSFAQWNGQDTVIDDPLGTTLDGPPNQTARLLTVNDYLMIQNGAEVTATALTTVNTGGLVTLSNESKLTTQGLAINGGSVWVGDGGGPADLNVQDWIGINGGSLLLFADSSIETYGLAIMDGTFQMGSNSTLISNDGSAVWVSISETGLMYVDPNVVFDNHVIKLEGFGPGGLVALDTLEFTQNSRIEGNGVIETVNGLHISDGAVLAPGWGDPSGVLEVNGALIIGDGGILNIAVGQTDHSQVRIGDSVYENPPGSGNWGISSVGSVSIDPNAQLGIYLDNNVNGSVVGDTFDIIQADPNRSITGEFGTTTLKQGDKLLPFLGTHETVTHDTAGNTVYQVEVTRNDYFTQQGQTHNQIQTGRLLDATDITNDDWWGALKNLSNLTAPQLQRFYAGMSGELKADSMTMYRATPWRTALDQIGWSSTGQGFLGNQNRFCPNTAAKTSVWFTPYYNDTSYSSDGNAGDCGVSSTGFLAGINRQLVKDLSSGIIFGYGRPELYRNGDSVTANDFLIGAQISSRLTTKIEMKSFIGVGFQQYEMSRRAYVPQLGGPLPTSVGTGGVQRVGVGADFDGNTLLGSIEIARPFYIDNFITLRPLVAFETEHVWQAATREYGAGLFDLAYAKRRNDQVFVRTGVSGEVGARNFSLLGRVFYSRQIGGTSYTDAETYLANDDNATVFFRGVDTSRDFLTIGGGANVYLGPKKMRTLSGSYDLILSDRTTSQTAFLTLTQLF